MTTTTAAFIPSAASDASDADQALRVAITALINLEDELLDHDRDFIATEVLDIKQAACGLLGRLRVVSYLL
jgi:hypothetical protein